MATPTPRVKTFIVSVGNHDFPVNVTNPDGDEAFLAAAIGRESVKRLRVNVKDPETGRTESFSADEIVAW